MTGASDSVVAIPARLLHCVDRGLECCSRGIAGFVGVPVRIVAREVRVEAVSAVPDRLRDAETLSAATYVAMVGDLGGHCLFTLSAEAAEALLRLAAAEFGVQEGDLGNSFLEELGNIAVSGFLSGVADAGGWRVVSTPPELAWSALGAMLESVLAVVAAESERALLVSADWRVGEAGLECGVLMLPDAPSMAVLLEDHQ